MNNIKNNKSSNDTCMFCPHQYSIHYSDDIHGLGSKISKMFIVDSLISILLMEVNFLVMVLGVTKLTRMN